MLTLEDRIALSDLTHEEIDAIAEHEHLPETIAAELGCTRAGIQQLRLAPWPLSTSCTVRAMTRPPAKEEVAAQHPERSSLERYLAAS